MAGEEESETKYTAKFRTTPPPQPVLFSLHEEEPGGPASLVEPPGPQERLHTMEQLADVAPMVPSLAVPEPQMVAMVKHVDSVVPEQIIAVPKISWPSRFPRTVVRELQKAEQLVDVPTVVSPSFFSQAVEQNVDIPVPGRGVPGRGGLQGFRPEQSSRPSDEQTIDSPGRKINTGPGSRRRPWYRVASFPVHRQSGGDPWLRLSRHLRTVQTVHFWGGTAATSSSSS